MNCKPNDLARIIDSPATRMHGCVDHIVRVTVLDDAAGEKLWHYEQPFILCKCGCGATLVRVADSVLRPIGNPGPDAIDETLVGKPAPVLEEISA